MQAKLNKLKDLLSEMGSVLIAYSGGVDSTFLIKVAEQVLGDKALAITADSEVQSLVEMEDAKKIAVELQANHIVVETHEMQNEDYISNPTDRCYYCKSILFTKLKEVAEEKNIPYVLDGSNADDVNDYRPGMIATNELGVRSPLKEVGLTKDEIRALSKEMGIPTWDKPALACLASRIPYGSEITNEKLRRVDKAETYLRTKGFYQVRVRDHGDIARIEVLPDDFEAFLASDFNNEVISKLKEFGYLYITIDLEGYKTGSMNKVLKANG